MLVDDNTWAGLLVTGHHYPFRARQFPPEADQPRLKALLRPDSVAGESRRARRSSDFSERRRVAASSNSTELSALCRVHSRIENPAALWRGFVVNPVLMKIVRRGSFGETGFLFCSNCKKRSRSMKAGFSGQRKLNEAKFLPQFITLSSKRRRFTIRQIVHNGPVTKEVENN